MRYLWGLLLASGIIVGQPDAAQAQFSISIGTPYAGGLYPGYGTGYGSGYNTGYSSGYGTGYGTGYGYNSYSSYGYGNGLYAAPVVAAPLVAPAYGYSSGYRGYSPVIRQAVPYRSYGYGPMIGGYRPAYGGYPGGVMRNYGGFRR